MIITITIIIIIIINIDIILHGTMDLQDVQTWLNDILREVSIQFQRVPGSAIFLRYVKSSYQNDPVRSAVELFLVLFAIRYLAAPAYSTQKKSYVTLSEEACHLPSGIGQLLTVCQGG